MLLFQLQPQYGKVPDYHFSHGGFWCKIIHSFSIPGTDVYQFGKEGLPETVADLLQGKPNHTISPRSARIWISTVSLGQADPF